MEKKEIPPLLKSNEIFQELSDEQLEKVTEISSIQSVQEGAMILNEGDMGTDMYLVIDGGVEVLKKDSSNQTMHRVSMQGKGEVFGAMALLDNLPRSASIRALKKTQLLVIPLGKIYDEEEKRSIFSQVIHNVSKHLSQHIRKSNDQIIQSLQSKLESEKARAQMGKFLFSMFVSLTFWIFLVAILHEFASELHFTSFVTFPILVIIFFIAYVHVKRSIYPPSFYGLSFKHWIRHSIEATLWTTPLLVGATVLKWFLVKYSVYPDFYSVIDLQFSTPGSPYPEIVGIAIFSAYILLVPFQEFVARGAIQSSIKECLQSPHRAFWAIILATLIFSSFHTFISFRFALAAFLGGIFWGWLYDRQGSLVGPCVSHALIGWWILGMLKFVKLLQPTI